MPLKEKLCKKKRKKKIILICKKWQRNYKILKEFQKVHLKTPKKAKEKKRRKTQGKNPIKLKGNLIKWQYNDNRKHSITI